MSAVGTNKITFGFFSDLPQEGPSIETPRKQYQVGETADLMCIAQNSNPATNLSWYINGEPVSPPFFQALKNENLARAEELMMMLLEKTNQAFQIDFSRERLSSY